MIGSAKYIQIRRQKRHLPSPYLRRVLGDKARKRCPRKKGFLRPTQLESGYRGAGSASVADPSGTGHLRSAVSV